MTWIWLRRKQSTQVESREKNRKEKAGIRLLFSRYKNWCEIELFVKVSVKSFRKGLLWDESFCCITITIQENIKYICWPGSTEQQYKVTKPKGASKGEFPDAPGYGTQTDGRHFRLESEPGRARSSGAERRRVGPNGAEWSRQRDWRGGWEGDVSGWMPFKTPCPNRRKKLAHVVHYPELSEISIDKENEIDIIV